MNALLIYESQIKLSLFFMRTLQLNISVHAIKRT